MNGIPPPAAVVVFLAALGAGGAMGFVSGRRAEPAPAVEEETAVPESSQGASGRRPAEDAAASGEVAALNREIEELKRRAEELRKRIPQRRSREQKLAFARDLLDLVNLAAVSGDPALRDRYRFQIPDLEPDMAVVFAEALRSGQARDVEVVTWMLLECGGPEASSWVLGLLDRDPLDPALRPVEQACDRGVSPFGFARFSVDGALLEKVCALAGSPSDMQFYAIGLLAFSDTPEARGLLRQVAESDPSENLRMLALNSLSRIATEETRTWFEAWAAGLPEAVREENESRLRRARRNIERRLAR
ncbi:MAG: hypothetical protein IT452_23725 [Planctomycetia bacterium]|nr:hypothetical protein [Planctomycetia bacterium]